jgi:hypothetical protein
MTSDEPTYPGEEGESVEEVLGPDSLREAADSNQTDSWGRWQMHVHADAWEAERKDNAALREKLASAKRILISEGWDAHKLDDAIDARAWPYGAPSEVKP